jgi:hypothetical protein
MNDIAENEISDLLVLTIALKAAAIVNQRKT